MSIIQNESKRMLFYLHLQQGKLFSYEKNREIMYQLFHEFACGQYHSYYFFEEILAYDLLLDYPSRYLDKHLLPMYQPPIHSHWILQVINTLLQHVNHPQQFLHDCLFSYLHKGYIFVIQYLINMHDIDLMIKDEKGNTLFAWICFYGYQELYENLINQLDNEDNFNINISQLSIYSWLQPTNILKQTMLMIAASNGQVNLIKQLYTYMNNEELLCVDENGWNVFHYICSLSEEKNIQSMTIFHYLFEQLTNKQKKLILQSKTIKEGWNLLMITRNVSIAQYLIIQQHFKDFHSLDQNGDHLFVIIVSFGLLSLLQYYVDVVHINALNVQSKTGRTLLHIASLKGYLSIIKYLYEEKHMNIYQLDHKGKTCIDLAISICRNVEVVKYFHRINNKDHHNNSNNSHNNSEDDQIISDNEEI